MAWTKATLIKRKTDNGLWEVQDDVPLGKEYMVNRKSIRMINAYNVPNRIVHKLAMIKCSEGVLFPLELLQLE